MRKKTVRITPLGYIVLSIIILVMLVGIYFIVWSMRGSKTDDSTAESTADVSASTTPTPSLAPVDAQTTDYVATEPPTTTAAAQETATMTPKQDDTPSPEVKTPSPEQVQSALDGTLNASGVVLRSGPSQSYDILGKYSSGTQLKVYEADGDYYFVKVVKENLYGYFAIKFVDKAGLLPGESATPTPEAIAGTIPGTVSASKLALRTVPTTEDNTPIGEIVKGDSVLIYFKTGDFYYIQVVATGVKCYAAAVYITASTTVPTGTPVP
ncbi:MAG TPA: SH3 domain-containing protein [Eubacteriales bacterium]|nr:SH3 domain-containing protein [Eubacteriales bacterium]